jgi:hypothetical protein
MIVYINFFGFDFIAEVDYRVTSWGCEAQTYGPAENCYPAEPPEFEIDRIWLYRDVPLTAEEHRRRIIKTPVFVATGALFDCLANIDKINDAIGEEIGERGREPPDFDDNYF